VAQEEIEKLKKISIRKDAKKSLKFIGFIALVFGLTKSKQTILGYSSTKLVMKGLD